MRCRARPNRVRLSVTPKSWVVTLCRRSEPIRGRWSVPVCVQEHRSGVWSISPGETIRRVRRAGARGPVSVRADSGFWSYAMLAALDNLGVGWSITTQVNAKVRAQITNIDKDAWVPIDYPRKRPGTSGGNRPGDDQPQEAVAETQGPSRGAPHPLGRFPSRAVPRLASPHLGHQPGPSHGRSRPAPPTPGRTRHRSGRTASYRDR